MQQQLIWHLLSMMAFALLCGYALTWAARIVAPYLGLVDFPDGTRKLHARAIPLMGGVAVLGAVAATILACLLVDLRQLFSAAGTMRVAALLWSAALFCALGLWDDRCPIRPRTKLLGQVLACIPFLIWGRTIEAIHLFGIPVELGDFGILFVLVWLVSCANMLNLLDGLDGLAGTVGLIVAVTLAALSLIAGNLFMACISLIVVGSLLGFLFHNWTPAKIFLGDAGSLTIGFLIGAMSIEACQKTAMAFTLVLPLVALSIPLFDTVMAILRRRLTGKSIGQADRGHIHHRLRERGLSTSQTVLAISTLCLLMAIVVVGSAYLQNDWIAASVCLVMLVLLVAGGIFGHDETTMLYRQTKLVGTRLATATGLRLWWSTLPQSTQVTHSHDSPVWNEVQRRATAIGSVRVEMTYQDEVIDTRSRRITWATEEDLRVDAKPTWNYEYSRFRDDDRQVNVTLVGYNDDQPDQQALDELVEVVQSLTKHWPGDATGGQRQAEALPLVKPQQSNLGIALARRAA